VSKVWVVWSHFTFDGVPSSGVLAIAVTQERAEAEAVKEALSYGMSPLKEIKRSPDGYAVAVNEEIEIVVKAEDLSRLRCDAADSEKLAWFAGKMATLEMMRGNPDRASAHARQAAHFARIAQAGRTATSCRSCGREPEDHGHSRLACGHYVRHGERYVRPMPEGHCEVCFVALGTVGCTNKRCESCHGRYCTEPGHERGTVKIYFERAGACACMGFEPVAPDSHECVCHHIAEDHRADVMGPSRRCVFNTVATFDPAKERLRQLQKQAD
jgi:hypothetical protein